MRRVMAMTAAASLVAAFAIPAGAQTTGTIAVGFSSNNEFTIDNTATLENNVWVVNVSMNLTTTLSDLERR
ncbi:MAG: hypothetical protein OXC68_15625 [Aestuariivita sp.]|nr:hypothetical protein [Aestuariivita sp.]